jgi:hypothetical protein
MGLCAKIFSRSQLIYFLKDLQKMQKKMTFLQITREIKKQRF